MSFSEALFSFLGFKLAPDISADLLKIENYPAKKYPKTKFDFDFAKPKRKNASTQTILSISKLNSSSTETEIKIPTSFIPNKEITFSYLTTRFNIDSNYENEHIQEEEEEIKDNESDSVKEKNDIETDNDENKENEATNINDIEIKEEVNDEETLDTNTVETKNINQNTNNSSPEQKISEVCVSLNTNQSDIKQEPINERDKPQPDETNTPKDNSSNKEKLLSIEERIKLLNQKSRELLNHNEYKFKTTLETNFGQNSSKNESGGFSYTPITRIHRSKNPNQ